MLASRITMRVPSLFPEVRLYGRALARDREEVPVPTATLFDTRRERMYPYLTAAACEGQDSELFYAEGSAAIVRAKSICANCVVRERCLEWAIKREEFGVWGGTTARERAAIRRQRGVRLVASVVI